MSVYQTLLVRMKIKNLGKYVKVNFKCKLYREGLTNSSVKMKELERYLQSFSFGYSLFGIGKIVKKDKHYWKSTLLLHLFHVAIVFYNFLFEFPAYMGSTNGLVCKLVTFIFHWSNLMKILCTCFRGIFRPNAVQHLISDMIKLEKNIREIKRRKTDRNNSLYRGLLFLNAWFPIIVCVIYAVDLNGNPEIRVGEIFQIINRVGLVVMHSSFCTFTLIIYLQLRETNKQYKRLRNSHLSLAHRIWGLKVAVWRHCTITKAWNQLIDVYESYLFFEMISMTGATLGSLYYVYSYFTPGQYLAYNFLPLREILLVVQAIYEIMIICKLCDSLVNEVRLIISKS